MHRIRILRAGVILLSSTLLTLLITIRMATNRVHQLSNIDFRLNQRETYGEALKPARNYTAEEMPVYDMWCKPRCPTFSDIIQTQQQRKQTVQQACRELKGEKLLATNKNKPAIQSVRISYSSTCDILNGLDQKFNPTTKDVEKFFYNDQYRVVYCHVPKVASRNLRRLFLYINGKVNVSELMVIHEKKFGILRQHSRALNGMRYLSQNQIKYRLRTYYKFMFVRDPFSRLLSAYRDKIIRTYDNVGFMPALRKKLITKYRSEGSRNDSQASLTELLKYLLDDDVIKEGYNEHWTRMVDLCHPCSIDYDFIGKLETLDEDIDFILKQMGVDLVFPAGGNDKTNATDEVASELRKVPLDYLIRMWNIYKEDFKLFGYEFPNYMYHR